MKLPFRLAALMGAAWVTLALASPAAAATITIGRVVSDVSFVSVPDGSGGFDGYAGERTSVSNTSLVGFVNLRLTAFYRDALNSETVECQVASLAPGGTSLCETTRFLQGGPWAQFGVSLFAGLSGDLASASFLLPDGSTFTANATRFEVPLFGDFYTPNHPFLGALWRDIVIEGTITPPDPSAAAVPEPGTLTLLLTGASALGWRVRRARRRAA